MRHFTRALIGSLLAIVLCTDLVLAQSSPQTQKVTVQNQAANTQAVAIRRVNPAGNAFEGCGSTGTQYTEGDSDPSITGTAIMWEDASDTLRSVSAAKPLPVNIVSTSVGSTVADEDGNVPAGTVGMVQVLNHPYGYNGTSWSREGWDPCRGPKSFAVIANDVAETWELVNGAGANNYYYICSFFVVTDASNNVTLAEDDTDDCGSITAAFAGSTTAGTGLPFSTNGGVALGSGSGTIMKSVGTNRYLCMRTSASTQISGTIGYVVAP